MKITVSSTSMMQPMFESQPNLQNSVAPTQRACGLLEPASVNDCAESIDAPVVQSFYFRPNTTSTPVIKTSWDNVQTIASRNHGQNFVVFGFFYDGEYDWLRVWVTTHHCYLWTQRQESMTYRSYAVVTMDALSKIPTNWDGELHSSPFQSSPDVPRCQQSVQASSPANRTSKNTVATVADAAANEHGDLWFLMVINSETGASADYSERTIARSGWIRA